MTGPRRCDKIGKFEKLGIVSTKSFVESANPSIDRVATYSCPSGTFSEVMGFKGSQLENKRLVYKYGNNWKYETWFRSEDRVVYKIRTGPLAGRTNFQRAYYHEVRPDIWQVSWKEETGTIVSLVVDLSKRHLFAFCVFSRGHIQYPDEAKGNKREDIDQWRELAKVGNDQTDSEVFSEDAKIDDIYEGRGDLDDIEDAWPTL